MTDEELLVRALLGLTASAVVTVAGWLWHQRRRRLDSHATLLADAYAAVAAYREFAFAVRRRDIDDAAKERVRVSEAMRPVQTDLTFHTAWVRNTSKRVSASYDALVGELRKVAGASIRAGWNSPPITTDEQMNMPEVAAGLAELTAAEDAYLAEVARYLHPLRYRLVRRIQRART